MILSYIPKTWTPEERAEQQAAADALAEYMLQSGRGTGEWACPKCGKTYTRIKDGVARWLCPHCGDDVPTETLAGALKQLKAWDKLHPPAATAPAESPPDDTPKAAPPMLDDVIGNPAAVNQLRTVLDAFAYDKAHAEKGKKLAFPHLLLSGPGGTGKGMLAAVVAREIGSKLHEQMGQTLKNPAKVAAALLALKPGDILFIDEIHGLKRECQETLYRAMEERLLFVPTKAGQAASKPVRLPPFTLIGATTDKWALLPSMQQRFKYVVELSRMTAADLARAMGERAVRRGILFDPAALLLIGERSLGTPRLAVNMLDGCLATAKAAGGEEITVGVVRMTCKTWEIDALGLGRDARNYLRFLAEAGGMLRLNVLASKMDGMAKTNVERKVEPDLVWLGLVTKEPNGRRLTAAGREHLQREGS